MFDKVVQEIASWLQPPQNIDDVDSIEEEFPMSFQYIGHVQYIRRGFWCIRGERRPKDSTGSITFIEIKVTPAPIDWNFAGLVIDALRDKGWYLTIRHGPSKATVTAWRNEHVAKSFTVEDSRPFNAILKAADVIRKESL